VLIALIANNQNASTAVGRPPTVHVDRGGGGPLWGTRYDIIDIVAAASTFPEISGEDPVARAVRRTKWIGDALPHVKEAREKRDAAVFLAGAQFADAAARAEPHTFTLAEIEQLIQIIDDVRGINAVPVQPKRDRGGSEGAMIALGFGLVLGGIAIGVAISRRQQPRRR
jgi:hypothetical protein